MVVMVVMVIPSSGGTPSHQRVPLMGPVCLPPRWLRLKRQHAKKLATNHARQQNRNKAHVDTHTYRQQKW